MNLPTRLPSALLRVAAISLALAALTACGGVAGKRPGGAAADVPAPRGNLLKNPGFEESAEKIFPWHIIVHADPDSYAFSLVPEAAYAGERGIRLARRADEPWGGLFQQLAYDNSQPATLRFSAWVRGESLQEPAVMQLRYGLDFADDRVSTLFVPVDQLAAGWSRIQVELQVPAGPTGIEATVLQYGPGHLMIDELTLEVVRD